MNMQWPKIFKNNVGSSSSTFYLTGLVYAVDEDEKRAILTGMYNNCRQLYTKIENNPVKGHCRRMTVLGDYPKDLPGEARRCYTCGNGFALGQTMHLEICSRHSLHTGCSGLEAINRKFCPICNGVSKRKHEDDSGEEDLMARPSKIPNTRSMPGAHNQISGSAEGSLAANSSKRKRDQEDDGHSFAPSKLKKLSSVFRPSKTDLSTKAATEKRKRDSSDGNDSMDGLSFQRACKRPNIGDNGENIGDKKEEATQSDIDNLTEKLSLAWKEKPQHE